MSDSLDVLEELKLRREAWRMDGADLHQAGGSDLEQLFDIEGRIDAQAIEEIERLRALLKPPSVHVYLSKADCEALARGERGQIEGDGIIRIWFVEEDGWPPRETEEKPNAA